MKPEHAEPSNFKVEEVLYTSPEGFSIAKGKWMNETESRFAMRWNGSVYDSDDKGFPTVFGHPMWFMLPNELNSINDILRILIENSRIEIK